MIDDVNALAFCVILVLFWIAALVPAVTAYDAFCSRKYVASGLFAVGLLAWIALGIPLGLSPGSKRIALYRESAEWYGESFWIAPSTLQSHSKRHFNGDGYSIEVYTMPQSLAAYLKNPPPNFTTDFPNHSMIRDNWELVHWRQTPVPTQDEYLEFAAAYQGPACELLNRLARKPGNWYAYCHYSSASQVHNIDYWLACPEERVIVWVNHNT